MYLNNSTKSSFNFESVGNLNIIDSKEKSISTVFKPEENKSILPMKNLDIQNEKVEEIIPLSDKGDRINVATTPNKPVNITILFVRLMIRENLA